MKRFLIAIGGLVVIGGVGVWIYRVRSGISYSFDFGSLVDAIVLLVIGVLIEYAYLKQSSDKRADTDLLLGLVAEAKTAFADLVDKAVACEGGKVLNASQQLSLTCAERELSNSVHSVEEGLRHCSITLEDIQFGRVKEARIELKDSLTDTPFPGPYDNSSRVRIRAAMKVMRDELTRLAFAINHR
jgi:hypothetical protein